MENKRESARKKAILEEVLILGGISRVVVQLEVCHSSGRSGFLKLMREINAPVERM